MPKGRSLTEQVLERLEGQGHRLTRARKAVLEAVLSAGDHFSAEGLRQALPQLSRATVYRTLRLLVEEGALCRVRLEDGAVDYRVNQPAHHHHLICTVCGSVQDFKDSDLRPIMDRLAQQADFQMEEHWLEIYGRCRECQE
jgi:Fur family ferric uptake transcriptional regulator